MAKLDKPDRWLKSQFAAPPDGVDRQAGMLRGYVVAQAGAFKSEGRGEFDRPALETIVRLGRAAQAGLKSRLGHPTMSEDGIGKFLGRSTGFRMATALDARTGKKVDAVRADLTFDPSASDTPHGNLAKYVMDLAESDPGAISSSLVLKADEEYRRNKDGTLQTDDEGEPLAPLWRPLELHASDIVDTGDAVDALLSPEELCKALSLPKLPPELAGLLRFDNVARLGSQLLDGFFRKQDRAEIEERCRAWLDRYLAARFADQETPQLDRRAGRMARLAARVEMLFTHNSKTSEPEPGWGTVDKTALPRLAFAEPGEPDKKSTWGYPHHWVKGGSEKDDAGVWTNGTLYLHLGGLNAAWSAAQGGRSGQKAPEAVIAHLEAHRRAVGLE